MFRSLRVRIALSHALVLLVILVALGVTLQFVLARTLDASVTRQLRASADGVAARIDEAGKPVPPADSDVPSDAAIQLAVYTTTGELVGEPAETPSWLTPGATPVTDLEVSGQRVLAVEEHGRELYEAAQRLGIVANRRADPYSPRTTWYKIKNPAYTQAEGRSDLF